MKNKFLQRKNGICTFLIVSLLSVAWVGKGFAQDFTEGNLKYSVNEDGVSVTVTGHVDGTSAGGALNIPGYVVHGGVSYAVTRIGNRAFYQCIHLSGSVTIPNPVTMIGDSAFLDCMDFHGSLTLPNSLIEIGSSAFKRCYNLTGNLTIPNSVTYIGSGAFSGCSGFTGNLTIGNSVTIIDRNAFYGCSGFTGSLIIGNSVTSIGIKAFYGCSGFTGSLTIGNSVTTIELEAFYGCWGFTGSLTIGNSVTIIGSKAFCGCGGFTGSLTIGNSVTTIKGEAFRGCSGFTGDLTIPNSVTSIGLEAFYYCSGFTGLLTIGTSVDTIGSKAFNNCSNFTGVRYNATNCTNADDSPFKSCVGHLVIGNNVESIPIAIFSDANFTGNLTIPNSVTYIGSGAFSGCSGFTGNLVIPNSVTTIGVGAFSGCSGFTGNLVIPNSVTTIGGSAFYKCSGFTGSLIIPNSVTTIGSSAFYDCSGFTGSLIIPNSVTSIGYSAFIGCNGFTEVQYNAINCADVEINNGYYYYYPFEHICGTLTINDNVERIPAHIFQNASFTGGLTIPNSVTSIGDNAFTGCSGFIGTLTLGASVAEIGTMAFSNMSIDTIISNRVAPPLLGVDAFSMTSIAALIVPCGSKESYYNNWLVFSNDIIHEDCNSHLITIDTNITGGTVVTSVSEAPAGRRVWITITPDTGMQLASTTVYNTNDSSQTVDVSALQFIMPSFDVTVTATFEPCDTYSISISPDITGGSVTASVSEAVAGETVTLYVFPDPGYELWSLNVYNANNATQTVSVTNNTFIMPSFDVMVSAIFEHNSTITHSISISPDITGGSVTASVSEAVAGETVTLYVFPDPDYELWSLNVYNANNATQTVSVTNDAFVMPSFDVMVSAVFNYTSVDEMDGKCVSVFPNPTSDQVKIEAEGIRKIAISNMLGQIIYEDKVSSNEFRYDFSNCEEGVYFIRIETWNGISVKKVLVNR